VVCGVIAGSCHILLHTSQDQMAYNVVDTGVINAKPGRMAPMHIVPVCDCIQCCWIWWRQCQIHLVICSIRKSGHSITYCTALQFPSTIYCTFSCLEAWVISVCILSFYPELVCNNFTSKQKVLLKNYFFQCFSDQSGIHYWWLGLGWSGQCLQV